jgi:hypothetical protein
MHTKESLFQNYLYHISLQRLTTTCSGNIIYLFPKRAKSLLTTTDFFQPVHNPKTIMRQTIKKPEVAFPMVTTPRIREYIGMSNSALRRWRIDGLITQNIHWQYAPGTKHAILWNLSLVRSWIAYGADQNHPEHKKLVEAYLKSIPCAA